MIRLFFVQENLFKDIHEYLDLFDYIHDRDCTEASCERWVSIIANIIINRYNLKMDRVEKTCVNKCLWTPDSLDQEKTWIESGIDEYFEGKHLQPFVVSENFKFMISSTVDRILRIFDSSDTCKDEDWSGIDDDFE